MKIETTLINAPADVQVSVNPQTGVVSISQPAPAPQQNQNSLSSTNQVAPVQQTPATGLVNTNSAPAPQQVPLQAPVNPPIDWAGIVQAAVIGISTLMNQSQANNAANQAQNAAAANTATNTNAQPNAQPVATTANTAQSTAEQPLVQPQVNTSVVKLSPEEEEKLRLELQATTAARDQKNAELAKEAAVTAKTVVVVEALPANPVIDPETVSLTGEVVEVAVVQPLDKPVLATAIPVIAQVAPVTPASIKAPKSDEEILAKKAAMIDRICVLKGFVPTIWRRNYLLNSRCKSYRSLEKEIDEMIIHGPAREKIFNCCYALGIPSTGISRLAFLVTENITTEQIIAVNMSKGLTADEIIAKYCPLKDEESFIDIDIMNAVAKVGYTSKVDPEYNTNIQQWVVMFKDGATMEEIQGLANVVLGGLENAEIAVVEELPAIQAVEEAPEVKSKIEELIEAAEVVETPAEPIDLLKELLKDPALAAHIEPAPETVPVTANTEVAQNDEVKLPTEAEVRDWSLDIVNHNKFDKVVLKAIKRAGITTIGQLLSLNSKEFADKLPKRPLIFAGQIDEAKSVAENFVLKHITPAQISAEPEPVEEKTE